MPPPLDFGADDAVVVAPERLAATVSSVFRAAGASKEEAEGIADNLTESTLKGHDSHGVVRVPRYLLALRRGQVFFGRRARPVVDEECFALLDGEFGFGQTLGPQAVRAGVEKARKNGVAMVALRRAGHLGRIGAWAEAACEFGIASVHFVNVNNSMIVAPFGAAERRISTAPFCVGVPAEDGGHFCLDFATSHSAEGKILMSLKKKRPAPLGALVDELGGPTLDPAALYGETPPGSVPDPRGGRGAMRTMGGHKGSGLAIACELLAGILTGSGASGREGRGGHVWNGMLSFYFDPARLDDGGAGDSAMRTFIDDIRAARPSDLSRPVLSPGDMERRVAAERKRNGIPLPPEVWENILEEGEKLGLPRGGAVRTAPSRTSAR